jgi:hypothetical protein
MVPQVRDGGTQSPVYRRHWSRSASAALPGCRGQGHDCQVDVEHRVRSVLSGMPSWQVSLVGSRARHDATPPSDWDFQIDAPDCTDLVASLPAVVREFGPLAAFWDPLSQRSVYMIVLSGPVKIDLFPCHEVRRPAPRWKPTATNLTDIDDQLWDWTLWLGGKSLRNQSPLVLSELNKMFDLLLASLGVDEVPEAISDAIQKLLRWTQGAASSLPASTILSS